MTDQDRDALERAEANFTTAKELCRTGHANDEGTTCTYGGMSSANGYWLAADTCTRSHGETCDLRALCDGAPTETGFRGSEPDPETWYWIWRVTACRPCADLYAAAHPQWTRKPPQPEMTYEETMRRLHEQVEADRAAMNPAQREASDMVTNMLLYGQHPAPESQFTGLLGLFELDEPITPPPVEPAG